MMKHSDYQQNRQHRSRSDHSKSLPLKAVPQIPPIPWAALLCRAAHIRNGAGNKKLIEYIDQKGGSVKVIEEGYMQEQIAASAYQYQRAIEEKQKSLWGSINSPQLNLPTPPYSKSTTK